MFCSTQIVKVSVDLCKSHGLQSTAGLLVSKGEMMKSVSLSVCRLILSVILYALVFWPCSCRSYDQPGETTAEGHRRHKRVLRINRQEMMADIDRIFLLDEPGKLTDKRIP